MAAPEIVCLTGKTFRYNVALAKEIGKNEMLVFLHLEYLIRHVRGKQSDGLQWAYKSLREMANDDLMMSKSTIQRTIKSLERKELILVRSDLNKREKDDTNWYAINPVGVSRLQSISLSHGGTPKITMSKSRDFPENPASYTPFGVEKSTINLGQPVPRRDDVTIDFPREEKEFPLTPTSGGFRTSLSVEKKEGAQKQGRRAGGTSPRQLGTNLRTLSQNQRELAKQQPDSQTERKPHVEKPTATPPPIDPKPAEYKPGALMAALQKHHRKAEERLAREKQEADRKYRESCVDVLADLTPEAKAEMRRANRIAHRKMMLERYPDRQDEIWAMYPDLP